MLYDKHNHLTMFYDRVYGYHKNGCGLDKVYMVQNILF